MTKFIENINEYLSQLKIKKTYISLKTGIEKNKLSRILNGSQDITSTDMEKIATALGKSVSFFLTDDFKAEEKYLTTNTAVVFYVGEPSNAQEEYAKEFIKLIENADLVLGAENRYMLTFKE